MKAILNEPLSAKNTAAATFGMECARRAKKFHASIPGYEPTPLHSLNALAQSFQINKIYVKDESFRFGLNAFKVLGGSYAIANYLAARLQMDRDDISYDSITSAQVKKKLGEITFVTATDGNHGRGVAWTASKLGQKSVVYMPPGTSIDRLNNILALGSDASITSLNYDDAVRLAAENAEKYGWVLVQDTAWEGYEEVPLWVMQGYTTMALEAYEQLTQMGDRPTHIFLQAGVGSMAAAVLCFFKSVYKKNCPTFILMEPEAADCFYRSAQAGERQRVAGDMDSIMAGLCCGEPSSTAWPILKENISAFLSCQDHVAARGMRIMSSPLGSDPKIISGESGAIGLGVLMELNQSEHAALREKLRIDADSRILFFSTEGDTDPVNYRHVVWDGAYPNVSFL